MRRLRWISLLITAFLAFSGLVAMAVPAQANGCITHSPTADGTQAHPFLIENVSNLNCLKNNAPDYWGAGLYFTQTADIDMTNEAPWTTGIGDAITAFQGHYDGGNHHIMTLTIAANHTGSAGYAMLGMFNKTAVGASISNLSLPNLHVTVSSDNVETQIGGLVGLNYAELSNIYVTGSIIVDSPMAAYRVGGLAGENHGSATHLASEVVITIGASVVPQISVYAVGVIFGRHEGATLDQAAAPGSISVTSGALVYNIGGIVGALYTGASVTNSWSGGYIAVESASDLRQVGGIAGVSRNTTTISNVFTTEAFILRVAAGTPISLMGTLLGANDGSATISNSVWTPAAVGATISNASGGNVSGSPTIIGTSSVTDTQLHSYSTYAGTNIIATPWSITNGYVVNSSAAWFICDNESAPILYWLTIGTPCTLTPHAALSTTTPLPGDRITITATGFTPGATAIISLHSTVVQLGTATPDPAGNFTTTVVIPFDTSLGAHEIQLQDTLTMVSTSVPITVTSALAATGDNSRELLPYGLALMSLGILILLLVPRARTQKETGF